MGPSTPYRVCRQVVFQLVLLVGMHEETVIHQQAQDHAGAYALVAGLLGPRAPAFLPLPVLHTNLDEPSQRLALDKGERAPAQVGGDQRARGLLARVWQRHDASLGFVGTALSPGTADDGAALCTPTDADGVGRPGMGGTIVGNGLVALVHADVLIAASLREHLSATARHRSAIATRRGPREGICGDTVPSQGGMVGVEPLSQP